jgi:hypothetical protein
MKLALGLMLALFSPLAFAASMSVGGLLNFVVYLVVVGLIFWCIWWFIGYVGVPEPFNKVIRVVLGLFALIIVINLLLGLVGTPFIRW